MSNEVNPLRIVKPEPTNEEKLSVVKAEFEKLYGKDKETRNAMQWRKLVMQYGIEQVCKTDGMTRKRVEKKMKFGKIIDENGNVVK